MHSKKHASNNSNNNNSNNNTKKKTNTQAQGSLFEYHPYPPENKRTRKDDVYVKEKSSHKRRKLEDAWLTEAELEGDRNHKKMDKLETELANETMRNFQLNRKLTFAANVNKSLDDFNQQLIREKEALEEKNAKLYNIAVRLQEENAVLKNYDEYKAKHSLIIYDNYHWDDNLSCDNVTKVNPEYQKTCKANNMLFKPQQKCENSASSVELFDMYYT